MTRLSYSAMVLLAACSAAPVAQPTSTHSDNTEGAHEQPIPHSGTMVIAPFTLQAEGTTIVVGEDGTVTVAGQANGQLLPNGSFVNEGEVLMSLVGNTLLINGWEVGTLSSEGAATVEGLTLRYDEAGRLEGGDGDGPALVLTPADTPARQAAMLLTLVLTL